MVQPSIISKRRIKTALDKQTGKEIIADEFFQQSNGEIFQTRYLFEGAIQAKEERYVCYYCDQPVKIIGNKGSKRILHFSHLRNSDDCPYKSGVSFSEDFIRRIKYNGAKESIPHYLIKTFIATSLKKNEEYSKGVDDVRIEKIIKGINLEKTWKRPDVSSAFLGNQVVFEIQLSTTFLSVIYARQKFYEENKTFIIWVFNVFETDDDKRKFTQSDVFYSNNHNAFELDEIAKEKSLQENDLVLKCSFEEPFLDYDKIMYQWKIAYVRLSDLTFNHSSYKVYFYDYNGEKDKLENLLALRKTKLINAIEKGKDEDIQDIFSAGYIASESEKEYIKNDLFNRLVKNEESIPKDTSGFRVILSIIYIKLQSYSLVAEFAKDYKLRETIISILSLKLNKIIKHNFDNQIRTCHLQLDFRPEHAEIFIRAIDKYQKSLLLIGSLKKKINTVRLKSTPQVVNERIVSVFFPELI